MQTHALKRLANLHKYLEKRSQSMNIKGKGHNTGTFFLSSTKLTRVSARTCYSRCVVSL